MRKRDRSEERSSRRFSESRFSVALEQIAGWALKVGDESWLAIENKGERKRIAERWPQVREGRRLSCFGKARPELIDKLL